MKGPIRLLPCFENATWGGSKIARFKGMHTNCTDIAQSWELSAVAGRESIVAEGDDAGMTLSDLVDKYGERLLGSDVARRYGCRFPLAVRLIDTSADITLADAGTCCMLEYPDHSIVAGHTLAKAGEFMLEVHDCAPDRHEVMVENPDSQARAMGHSLVRHSVEGTATIANPGHSFMGLICIDGHGAVCSQGLMTPVQRGDTLLLPAHTGQVDVEGRLTLLSVTMAVC